MLSRALGLLAVFLAAAASTAGAQEAEPLTLHAEPVSLEVPDGRGPIYLGADAKGRLGLVRGTRFYEVLGGDEIRPWGEPETREGVFETGRPGVLDASRSRDGRWILVSPDRVSIVSRSEVEILPAPTLDTLAVGFADRPVAAVIPVIRGRVRPQRFDPASPPLLVEHTSSGWVPLTEEAFSEAEKEAPESLHTHRSFRALTLAPASAGGLWAANRYLYRLRRFGDSGQAELDLTLGEDTAVQHLGDEAVEKLRESLAERAALLGEEGAPVQPFTARPVLQAVVEGRDGKVYLYVAPDVFGPAPLLDRYDPTTQRLERAVLDLEHPGRVTLAAARDGLWIAAMGAGRGIWRISWTTLQESTWQSVPGTRLDGLPTAPLDP